MLILSYGVISIHENACILSRQFFLQEFKNDEEIQKKYSAHLNVDKHFPKTFIWYSSKDSAVNPLDNINVYESLKKHNIGCQIHSNDTSKHELGLLVGEVAKDWLDKALELYQKN